MDSPTVYDYVYQQGKRGVKRLGNYANPMNPAKNLYQAAQYVNPLAIKMFAEKSPVTLKIEETREILKENVQSLMNGLQAQYPDRVAGYLKSNTKKNLTAEVRNLQRQKRDLTELLKPNSNRSLRTAATPKSKKPSPKATPKSKKPSPKATPKSKKPSPKASPRKRTPKRNNSSSQSSWSS